MKFDPFDGFEDEHLGAMAPADMHKCGITPEQIKASCGHLYSSATDMENSDFMSYQPNSTAIFSFNKSLRLLKLGTPALLEPLRLEQPRSWAVLSRGSELWGGFYVKEIPPFDDISIGGENFLFHNGRAYWLNPHGEGFAPADGYDPPNEYEWFPSIFYRTWLYHLATWQFIRRWPASVVPHAGPLLHRANWTSIDRQLDLYGPGYKKKFMPRLKAHFGEADWKDANKTHRFVCFLNIRVPEGRVSPGSTDPLCGDQFFVHLERSDERVYHVHRGDITNLRTIPEENLAEAFDGYFAHIFSRTPGEYDFMPFSRPWAKI
jgi:hypothetical protein